MYYIYKIMDVIINFIYLILACQLSGFFNPIHLDKWVYCLMLSCICESFKIQLVMYIL